MDKEDKEQNHKPKRSKLLVVVVILVLVIFSVMVMAVNSKKPGPIMLKVMPSQAKGSAFVEVNIILTQQLAKNWLPNDLYWPTVFLDNMPNFQLGALEVVRYNVRGMRDNLSRMRTTDKLDPMVETAFTALSNDPYKWWLPSAENKWQAACDALSSYHAGLQSGGSHFYPRADNLVDVLDQYVSLMGGVNTRLINAPRDMLEVLTVDEDKNGASGTPKMVDVNIPWHLIDDNFYYAQGVAYALLESFKAIRLDFMDVLKDKNSLQILDKIIEDLGRCEFEPLIVFNGNPESIFANHSLNLSGIFNDARQKINSLTMALKQG